MLVPGHCGDLLTMDDANRRLAGILAADVVGYSAMVGTDEPGTLARVRELRAEVIQPLAATHGGRLFKTTGDGFFVEFASAVQALRCGIAIQGALRAQPDGLRLRIGVHQGEVVPEGDDLMGDGVIIAARLEPLAEPGGICISSRVREDAAGKMALEVDDLGKPALKNIAAKIRAFRVRMADAPREPAKPDLTLPDKPSIAVLPFQNMSGDPEQEYFADGMVEEIITALSRIRWLFVIARNSSFTYKGRTVDIKQVGRELGVRYVLEGSVRKAGQRVRITAQLIDAQSGAHLWADRFDGSLEDIFELQDQVAISVAGVIEPTLQTAEIRRSSERPTSDLTAYDLYLRALRYHQSEDREGIFQALNMVRRAIARDQRYGIALALAALCHGRLYVTGWDDPDANRREGLDLARQALRAAGQDPNVLGRVAYVFGNLGEDINAAIALIDRAVELNPSFAVGWANSGWLRLWAGQPDLALEYFATSLRLSPRENALGVLLGIGIGHFFARRFEEARATLLRSVHESPGWVPNYRFLASCCAQMGRLDEAREIVQRLRALTPLVVPSATHWRNPEQRELYLAGLRLAMGEAE